jgi:hypothetical protein
MGVMRRRVDLEEFRTLNFGLKSQVYIMVAILTLLLYVTCCSAFAQTLPSLNSIVSQEQHTDAVSESFASRAFTFAIGTKSADGFGYMPYGWHLGNDLTASNISKTHFISLTKNGISGSTFINSFGDRTWSLGFSRTLFVKNRIGLDYSVGLMVGYQGKLPDFLPQFLRPLFEGNLNPYIMASPYYRITEKLEARLVYAPPRVILFGFNYLF